MRRWCQCRYSSVRGICEGALRNPAAVHYGAALCEPELARFDYFADGGGEQLLHPVV